MTLRLVSGALLTLLAIGSPVAADGSGEGGYRRPSAVDRTAPRRWAAPRGAARYGRGSIAIEAASYGPPPGHGGALHAPVGPILVELHEPYLLRGVLYNVPPSPIWGAGWAGGAVRALN